MPTEAFPSQIRFMLPSEDSRPIAACIGVMDGVHVGHQALIARTRAYARDLNLRTAAVTFDPHPSRLFAPDSPPKLLQTAMERVTTLWDYGISRVIILPFDAEMARLSPEIFLNDLLLIRYNIRALVTGEDFRFGAARAGDAAFLASESARGRRFSYTAVEEVRVDGMAARSTNVRNGVESGDMRRAELLLGRHWSLSGTVVRGRQLGRTLGYPTANLLSEGGLVTPGSGVYAGFARFWGETHRAAISVGTNPTVTDAGVLAVEAFVMDGFDGDLYGETVTLEFVEKLRDTEKFATLPDLVAQMGRDVARASEMLPKRI